MLAGRSQSLGTTSSLTVQARAGRTSAVRERRYHVEFLAAEYKYINNSSLSRVLE